MSCDSAQICVIIPTYNNCTTLVAVIEAVRAHIPHIIVINDGSTDRTAEILSHNNLNIDIIQYSPNRGKGYALMQGFVRAWRSGYHYAITIDSDGQHSAEDIEKFTDALKHYPDAMVVGARSLHQENMPAGNTFANKFSNFWFTVQTARQLSDTQSGFRLYPLQKVAKMNLLTRRYESELEIMVRLAWSGVRIMSVPISVYYAPDGERVSHFRPGKDFLRISLLNTFLTLLAVVYGYPRMLFDKIARIW